MIMLPSTRGTRFWFCFQDEQLEKHQPVSWFTRWRSWGSLFFYCSHHCHHYSYRDFHCSRTIVISVIVIILITTIIASTIIGTVNMSIILDLIVVPLGAHRECLRRSVQFWPSKSKARWDGIGVHDGKDGESCGQ